MNLNEKKCRTQSFNLLFILFGVSLDVAIGRRPQAAGEGDESSARQLHSWRAVVQKNELWGPLTSSGGGIARLQQPAKRLPKQGRPSRPIV